MTLDVPPEDLATVQAILARLVPGREVWAFGSRVKGTARRHSDLDLAIPGEEPLGLALEAELMDELMESDLSIKVDVVDLATCTPEFRAIVTQQHVVLRGAA